MKRKNTEEFHAEQLAKIDAWEHALEQDLKRVRELRREYINTNQLNKKVGKND